MNEETEEIREPRSLRGRHPLFFFGMLWILGAMEAAIGIGFYFVINSIFQAITDIFPAPQPIFFAFPAAGIIVGASIVIFLKRRLRRKGEEIANSWVWPRERTLRRTLAIAGVIGILALIWGIYVRHIDPVLQKSLDPSSALSIMCGEKMGIAIIFFLQLFLYPDYVRVYTRAKEIAAQYQSPEETPKKARRPLPWPGIISIFSIGVVLALAAWLLWILPQASTAEPEPFETEMIIGKGPATRLTYGVSCYSPAISPDGKFIAYRRGFLDGQLEIMKADGHGKRSFNKQNDPSPYFLPALDWSPDSAKLLLVGTEPIQSKNGSEMRSEEEAKRKLYFWIIDTHSGAARKFSVKDNPLLGCWLPGGKGIAAVAGSSEASHVWLLDENGKHPREVKGITLTGHYPSVHPWHDGRAVVVACSKGTPGIWSVDVQSAKATQLTEMSTYWAIPYDETRLVIGARGKAYPPRKSATSIGLFDTKTGEIKWALKDIQGSIYYPHLLQKSAKLVCVFSRGKDKDVWTISLKDGGYDSITAVGGLGQIAVAPDEASVVFTASDIEIKTPVQSDSSLGLWRLTPSRLAIK